MCLKPVGSQRVSHEQRRGCEAVEDDESAAGP